MCNHARGSIRCTRNGQSLPAGYRAVYSAGHLWVNGPACFALPVGVYAVPCLSYYFNPAISSSCFCNHTEIYLLNFMPLSSAYMYMWMAIFMGDDSNQTLRGGRRASLLSPNPPQKNNSCARILIYDTEATSLRRPMSNPRELRLSPQFSDLICGKVLPCGSTLRRPGAKSKITGRKIASLQSQLVCPALTQSNETSSADSQHLSTPRSFTAMVLLHPRSY